MAYIRTRSKNAELLEGATDAKYRKVRPDTTQSPMNAVGNATTGRNRSSLNPLDGYQEVETPNKVNPGK